MEDPVYELRQAISRIEFYWDQKPNAERTVKLAAAAGKIRGAYRMIRDEIDRCTTNSQPCSSSTKTNA